MFVLKLNDMRSPRVEILASVFRAATKEELVSYLQSQLVEGYSDDGEHRVLHHSDAVAQAAGGLVLDPPSGHRWHKAFKQGGPLEWYNAPMPHNEHEHFVDVISRETFLERMGAQYDREIGSIPQVPT